MQLHLGSRLGPYEVLAPLGAGGMGEVYRARDPRLGRDVALKIVTTAGGEHDDRFRRFEQEAKAVAALNHPHVMSVYDVGTEEGVHYVIFELLEGRTLRERIGKGPIPQRKAVELGVQIGRGLAAAHARGIIHRDLKPENLFVTSEGQIKILDFGIAKLTEVPAAELEAGHTLTATEPGFVVGTAGYTSPEQLRGRKADARSDLFALGAILYEMLSGRPAFGGETRADRSSAVLHHDPPELASAAREPVSPGLERIVRRCLEKDPEERFQTARDVAFALEALGGSSARETVLEAPRPLARRLFRAGAAGLLVAAAVATGLWTGRLLWQRPVAQMKQLTFRRGNVTGAHFAPDDRTVVYSAAWDGKPSEVFTTRLESPESRSLGLPPARLLSVSSSAELAILLTKPGDVGFPVEGTLARVSLSGGVPRQVLDDVENADWSPDGKELAVVRRVGDQSQLEYPLGKVLWREVPESADHWVRVSPRGDKVAYLADGELTIVDRSGARRSIAIEPRANGLAWSPGGDAVWATMSGMDNDYAVWRVGLDGTRREVYQAPGPVILHDVARSGAMLVHHGFEQLGLRVKAKGETAERDLTLSLLSPRAMSISADGSHLVLWNMNEQVFLCPTRGGEPLSLSRGNGGTISPDGNWVAMWPEPDHKWTLVPTGPGEPRRPSLGTLRHSWTPDMFPDSNRLVFWGSEPDASSSRGFVLEIATGAIRPVTPLGVTTVGSPAVNDAVLARQADGTLAWYPLSGGDPRPTRANVPESTVSIRTTPDGRWTFVGDWRGISAPIRIDRIDLLSGRREAWRTFGPDDLTGVARMVPPFPMTPDGEAYAYNYLRVFQDLFLVEGLR